MNANIANIADLTAMLRTAAAECRRQAEQPLSGGSAKATALGAARLIDQAADMTAQAPSAQAARQRLREYAEQLFRHYANADELAAHILLRTVG